MTQQPRRRLTEKQRQTLIAAFQLGFYETPRRAKLDALAAHFGVSKAAVHTRLGAAEAAVVRDFVEAAVEADRVEKERRERATERRLQEADPRA